MKEPNLTLRMYVLLILHPGAFRWGKKGWRKVRQ